MSDEVFTFCLFVVGLFQRGLTQQIQTQETVLAAVGGEAHLSCQLRETKDVLQVTWQKFLRDEDKNVATFSPYAGQRLNPDFRSKVEFKDPGLQNTSIVIKDLAEEDECCYQCMFNTDPDGALTAVTCIQLYELHEPILHVTQSNSSAGSVVSCSTTGRPVPTVTLTSTQQHLIFSHHNTSSVHNTNNTVTVTATALLSRLHDNSLQVGCAARVLSAPQMEVFVMIPELKETSDDDEQSGSDHRRLKWIWIFPFVIWGCIAVIICVLLLIKNQNRKHHVSDHPETSTREISKDLEMNENPGTAFRFPDQTSEDKEHCGPQENANVRQRSPQKQNKENDECDQSLNP